MEIQIIPNASLKEKPVILTKNVDCLPSFKHTSEWTASVKQFAASNIYTSLDMVQTGKKLHYIFIKNGCTVKDIQFFFKFSVSTIYIQMAKGADTAFHRQLV